MYKCVGMTKKDLNILQKLNSDRNEFNEMNLDFFPEYNATIYPMQLLLLRKVKLLKINLDYVGFSWVNNQNRNITTINSMYVSDKENLLEGFKTLISATKGRKCLNYFCTNKNQNFELLNQLGFEKKTGNFEMQRNNDIIHEVSMDENISFQIFEKGKHEELRSVIQNEIFKNSNRIPLTVADIYFDELQDYYYDKGSVFIKYRNRHIGYGQIIIDEGKPTIVNFGIINNYRNKGFGKMLLNYLLNIIKAEGYKTTNIRVRAENHVAFKLYSSFDFKIIKESFNFQLKRR